MIFGRGRVVSWRRRVIIDGVLPAAASGGADGNRQVRLADEIDRADVSVGPATAAAKRYTAGGDVDGRAAIECSGCEQNGAAKAIDQRHFGNLINRGLYRGSVIRAP